MKDPFSSGDPFSASISTELTAETNAAFPPSDDAFPPPTATAGGTTPAMNTDPFALFGGVMDAPIVNGTASGADPFVSDPFSSNSNVDLFGANADNPFGGSSSAAASTSADDPWFSFSAFDT